MGDRESSDIRNSPVTQESKGQIRGEAGKNTNERKVQRLNQRAIPTEETHDTCGAILAADPEAQLRLVRVKQHRDASVTKPARTKRRAVGTTACNHKACQRLHVANPQIAVRASRLEGQCGCRRTGEDVVRRGKEPREVDRLRPELLTCESLAEREAVALHDRVAWPASAAREPAEVLGCVGHDCAVIDLRDCCMRHGRGHRAQGAGQNGAVVLGVA